jgi:AcrR family transcriptional regulator
VHTCLDSCTLPTVTGQPAAGSTAQEPTVDGYAQVRRSANRRGEATLGRLLDAAAVELREQRFEGLTVRGAARRAGLAPATAYTYFSSKEHLVAELFWRLVADLPVTPVTGGPPADRAAGALSPVAEAVVGEPELARACTRSLLLDEPDVRRLRRQISDEWARRVTAAVDGEVAPEQVGTLLLAWTGMLVAAGMGHLRYEDVPRQLAVAAGVTIGGGGR